MKSLFTIALCLFCLQLHAQDWKTVRTNDTTYFAGSQLNPGYRLRVIWIDSTFINGSDTEFVFYKAIRDTSLQTCIDSVADTWLGRRFIRKPDGTEYYFNSYSDTITVQTKAGSGATWQIAKSHNGLVNYIATMGAATASVIDGVADSVKTITIQAHINSAPVNSWYNNKQLVLSKDHGWVKALDLYTFPDTLVNTVDHGAEIDAAQHWRINSSVKSINLRDTNPFSRYAAGNEWIERNDWYDSFWWPNVIQGRSYRHDSVISSQVTSPTTLTVVMAVDSVASIPTGLNTSKLFDTSFTRTITLIAPQPLSLNDTTLPEYNWRLQYLSASSLDRYIRSYEIDTACADGRYILHSKSNTVPTLGYISNNGCISMSLLGLFYLATINWSYLSEFGYSEYYYYFINGDGHIKNDHSTFPYININGCTIGQKIDVHTVGINDPSKTETAIIYPNPTRDYINVKTVANGNASQTIVISDVTGRVVLRQNVFADKTIDVRSLVPGTYIVHITMQGQRFAQKLVIVR